MKGLAIRLVVVIALLSACDFALSRHAERSFPSVKKLAEALAKGGDGLVFVGDSRAAHALDFGVVKERLKLGKVPYGIADLTLRGSSIRDESLMTREFVRVWPNTRGVVLVFGMIRMLEEGERQGQSSDPDKWIGSASVLYRLIRPSDLILLYPEGPLLSAGYRFKYYLGHFSALYRYRAALFARVNRLRARLTHAGNNDEEFNEFGKVKVTAEINLRMYREILRELKVYRRANDWQMNPWFENLRAELKRRKIPLHLVELPVIEQERRTISESAEGNAFRSWLRHEIELAGGHYLELRFAPGISDADFPDTMHMSAPAAARFSKFFGDQLADRLRSDIHADP